MLGGEGQKFFLYFSKVEIELIFDLNLFKKNYLIKLKNNQKTYY